MSGLDSFTQPAWNSIQSCPTPVVPYDPWTFGVSEVSRAIYNFSFCTTTNYKPLLNTTPLQVTACSTQVVPVGL